MHHCITYMYINFQQNWVSRSVKNCAHKLFAKNCKLHKFATIPIVFFKNQFLQTCIIIKRTCISIFSKIGFCRSVKTVHTIYLQKNASRINLQLLLIILKISIISDMHHRKTYMYINFQQNRVSSKCFVASGKHNPPPPKIKPSPRYEKPSQMYCTTAKNANTSFLLFYLYIFYFILFKSKM